MQLQHQEFQVLQETVPFLDDNIFLGSPIFDEGFRTHGR